MKNKCLIVISGFFFLATNTTVAQVTIGIPNDNVNNFTSFFSNEKNISSELIQATGIEYRDHPEFGILPYNAPCTDCYEILEKRTESTRYFVKNGTNGSEFYSQACMSNLHYQNENSELITIDPNLLPDVIYPGIYKALQQPNPTELNMTDGYSSIRLMDNSTFKFNQDLITYSTDDFTAFDNLQFINRHNYQVGANGVDILNAFNQTDMQQVFGQGEIKSSFFLKDKTAFDNTKKYYVIEDAFTLPDGHILKYDKYDGKKNINGFWYGNLVVENSAGKKVATIKAPIIFDNNLSAKISDADSDLKNVISYEIEQIGNDYKLKIIIETKWLNDPQRTFPITIDPLVYGETTTWEGVKGMDYVPLFCTTIVSVPTPAMATLKSTTLSWVAKTSGFGCGSYCTLSSIFLNINTLCGTSPAPDINWMCFACDFPGIWSPTVVDTVVTPLVSCFAPSCESYNIDFNVNFAQSQCNTPGGCVTTCAYLQKFTATIEGELITGPELCNGLDDDCNTLIDDGVIETISISAVGPTMFCQGGSVVLSATYSGTTVQWQKNGANIPGAIFSTYTATKKGNYTCVTTSSCDTVTSSGIFVNVLKNPAASISAGGTTTFCAGGSVTLTEVPSGGCTYQWYKGASAIAGATTTNYIATTTGNYKCRVTKTATGCYKNSNAIAVSVPCKEGEWSVVNGESGFTIYPNPANDKLNVQINSQLLSPFSFLLTITDLEGREIYTEQLNSLTTEINISDFASGMYFVKTKIDETEIIEKFIKN